MTRDRVLLFPDKPHKYVVKVGRQPVILVPPAVDKATLKRGHRIRRTLAGEELISCPKCGNNCTYRVGLNPTGWKRLRRAPTAQRVSRMSCRGCSWVGPDHPRHGNPAWSIISLACEYCVDNPRRKMMYREMCVEEAMATHGFDRKEQTWIPLRGAGTLYAKEGNQIKAFVFDPVGSVRLSREKHEGPLWRWTRIEVNDRGVMLKMEAELLTLLKLLV